MLSFQAVQKRKKRGNSKSTAALGCLTAILTAAAVVVTEVQWLEQPRNGVDGRDEAGDEGEGLEATDCCRGRVGCAYKGLMELMKGSWGVRRRSCGVVCAARGSQSKSNAAERRSDYWHGVAVSGWWTPPRGTTVSVSWIDQAENCSICMVMLLVELECWWSLRVAPLCLRMA